MQSATQTTSSVKPFRILIVDDEVYILDFLREALEFWGYEVVSASDSAAAFEIVKRGGISLLITDIRMEEDDSGIKLIENSKTLFPDLMIIIVTGSFADERTMNFCEHNDVSYLQKPLRANELKALITKTFSQHARELELKSDIQAAKKIIENTFPRKNPECPAIDLFSIYRPVYDIGGDFYDFIKLEDGRHLIYLCDVEGHGIHAAIFANTIRIFMRAFAETTPDLGRIVEKLNRAICAETRSNSMATAFFACYDPSDNSMLYVNAGHEQPLLYRAGAPAPEFLETTGTIIGIFEDADYKVFRTDLAPGDILFLYTDGVCDNYNASYENFSIETVKETIAEHKNENSHFIGRRIISRLQKHLGGNLQHDDLAFILLKINQAASERGNGAATRPRRRHPFKSEVLWKSTRSREKIT